jgi:hypothetical protein
MSEVAGDARSERTCGQVNNTTFACFAQLDAPAIPAGGAALTLTNSVGHFDLPFSRLFELIL